MKHNSRFLYFLIIPCFLFGCKNTDEKVSGYIQSECTSDTCTVDLKRALDLEYDSMYLFDSYSHLKGIQSILGIEYLGESKLLPEGFLVEDGHKKIILVKNRTIVYEDDFEPKHIKFNGGKIVQKEGLFDSQKIIYSAKLFTSTKFYVEKIVNEEGHSSKYFYILRDVDDNGQVSPIDTLSDN